MKDSGLISVTNQSYWTRYASVKEDYDKAEGLIMDYEDFVVTHVSNIKSEKIWLLLTILFPDWCLLFIRRKYESELITMALRRDLKEAITTGQMLEAAQLFTL